MTRKMLKSKIHRATVTDADLNYEGSLTVDSELLDLADILENEFVYVWNLNNGSRFETYALRGEPGSGVIQANGAAARMVAPGDMVIIGSSWELSDEEAKAYQPRLIFVDEKNKPIKVEGVPHLKAAQ